MKIAVYVGGLAKNIQLRITDQGDDSEPSITFDITQDQAYQLREELEKALKITTLLLK